MARLAPRYGGPHQEQREADQGRKTDRLRDGRGALQVGHYLRREVDHRDYDRRGRGRWSREWRQEEGRGSEIEGRQGRQEGRRAQEEERLRVHRRRTDR